jgi:hypothetical protein
MLDVYYTIDTEFWATTQNLETPKDYEEDFDRDIYGRTPQGEYGLGFQLKRFAELGFKASCFVETTHSLVLGIEPLERMVNIVREYEHDVQLHCHTEWLSTQVPWELPPLPSPIEGKTGLHMRHFSESNQAAIIAEGIAALQHCGIPEVCAFRAGNYGANLATLRALSFNGILYDTSYNYPYLNSACQITTPEPLLSPKRIEGVWEIPIPYFDTFRGPRHVQVSAASNAELEAALMHAYEAQWKTFVIVSHSFELVHREKENTARYNAIQTRRFEKLCLFLKKHSDKFRTRTFSELAQDENLDDSLDDDPSKYESHAMSSLLTVGRLVEHARQRWGW